MSNPSLALPPNPSLVAILLVVRTRAGQPHLVFHYPHAPSLSNTAQTAPPAHASWYGGTSTGASGDESSTEQSSDSDEDRSTLASRNGSLAGQEDEKRSKAASGKSKRDGSKPHTVSGPLRSSRRDIDDELETGSGDEDDDDEALSSKHNALGMNGDASSSRPDWERVLGFHVDALSKLLTPSRTFNKKRFEVGIDNLVFLGCPMFVREDGTWKKQKRRKHRSGKSEQQTKQQSNGTLSDADLVSGFEPGYGHGLASGAASATTSGPASEAGSLSEPETQISMFQVILVLNPPALEYHVRVDDMYEFVARKLAKFFKQEQAQKNIICEEFIKIQAMKERGRETRMQAYLLWPKIIDSSSLAKALVDVFLAISDNNIAHIQLDKSVDKALQIPRALSTPFISTTTEPQVPGLWLTTTPFADEEEIDPILNPHSALLFLEDEEALIKDIEHDDKALTGPLTWFIRNTTPTKSLQKQFNNTSAVLLFKDAAFLARRLIYWRRARAIPPLHHRDTYIVSPNADMRALSAAVPAFATRFPTLPPLPKILERLSGPPRPYYTLMPSKDHREAYMAILAWLMRGGWVTQLKSFAWVSVPTKVKQEVRKNMAGEVKIKALKIAEKELEHSDHAEPPVLTLGHRATDSGSSNHLLDSPVSSSAPSPRLTAYRSPSHPASEAGSINSERTAIPYRPMSPSPPTHPNTLPVRPSPLHIEQQASPDLDKSRPSPSVGSMQSDTARSGQVSNAGFDVDVSTPSIIQSPQKANALESRWIEHIGGSFADQELTELWPGMLKYFDGKHALDEIALREGLKRKTVASVILRLRDAGLLLTVRHW